MSALIKIENIDYLTFFTGDNVDEFIAETSKNVANFKRDMSTQKGRDEIKSHAYTLNKAKAALDEGGKALVEKERKRIDYVNEKRNKLQEELEKIRVNFRKPLSEYEEKEKERIKASNSRLGEIRDLGSKYHGDDVTSIELAIVELNVLIIFDWQKFQGEADRFFKMSSEMLEQKKIKAIEVKKQKAELEALRKANEEREEKAKKKAAEEAEKHKKELEKEREKLEALRKEAQEKEKKEREERLKTEAKEAEKHKKEMALKEKELSDAKLELEEARNEKIKEGDAKEKELKEMLPTRLVWGGSVEEKIKEIILAGEAQQEISEAMDHRTPPETQKTTVEKSLAEKKALVESDVDPVVFSPSMGGKVRVSKRIGLAESLQYSETLIELRKERDEEKDTEAAEGRVFLLKSWAVPDGEIVEIDSLDALLGIVMGNACPLVVELKAGGFDLTILERDYFQRNVKEVNVK